MKVTCKELFNIFFKRNSYRLYLFWDMSEFAKEMGYENFRQIRDIETLMNLEVDNDWHRECRNEILLGLLRGECNRGSKITFTPTDNGGWKVDIEKKPRTYLYYNNNPKNLGGDTKCAR